MNQLYESKFMQSLQHLGEKLAGNKVFSAISNGMMASMGVVLVGALFQIIATLLDIFHITDTSSPAYQFFMTPYDMTMGLFGVVVSFTIAYTYAKGLGMKTVVNGINSMLLFLMVASPVTTVILKDGKTTFTGLDTTSLGSSGLFAAILVGILSVRITYSFEKHHIVLKMPDAVPQFLQDSFSSLIPLAANVLIWYGLNSVLIHFTSRTLPVGIQNVLEMPLHALTSVPGMLICLFLATFMWSFGIHGSLIIATVLMPMSIQAATDNAALITAGKPAVFVPVMLFGALATCGGTGNTLSLVVMGLRSKSAQLKAISKAALIPGVFNINEPVTFGFPIMYNPILAIPYILNTIVTALLLYLGYSVGFFQPAYVAILTVLPLGVGEFLSAMAWQNILIPVIGFAVSYIFYKPFFTVYERQLVAKETAAKADA